MSDRRNRVRTTEREPVTPVWPESRLDVDDEAFARAIAEGRRSQAA